VLSATSGRIGRSFATEGGLATAKLATGTGTCLGPRRFDAKEMDAGNNQPLDLVSSAMRIASRLNQHSFGVFGYSMAPPPLYF